MNRGPVAAARLVEKYLGLVDPPRTSRALLEQIVIGEAWAVGDDAAELAEKWRSKFEHNLELLRQNSAASAISFTFNSVAKDHVQGACFCEPHDPPEVVAAKSNRSLAPAIRRYFDTISPTDFEKLCACVLKLLGAHDPKFSRQSGDQGIDFFGQAPFSSILAPEALPAGVEASLRVWLVGQAKRYKETQVTTADLRELVGSTQLARAKAFSGSGDPLADLDIKVCDPVFYILITSGKFTTGSRRLIANAGIIAMDGAQLSQFLADHEIGKKGKVFHAATFRKWIKTQATPAVTVHS
ncbi:MAG: restriction endonuclease [Brevundimonas sp.]|uniref:restriction endonuclease n=1 Tax=Brevundimonas sp. TaxID=1871086 RepID=UPI001A34389B|nr:restriction endonuclease [Brevundimonas sp.]MBJ7447528.1 restriction endonuclease [Brevundimonas sp.]